MTIINKGDWVTPARSNKGEPKYIIRGKHYKVVKGMGVEGDSFHILDERGREDICLLKDCAHVGSWRLVSKYEDIALYFDLKCG